MQDLPELDSETKGRALVHCWADRLRIADYLTTRLSLYEGQLKQSREGEADTAYLVELRRVLSILPYSNHGTLNSKTI